MSTNTEPRSANKAVIDAATVNPLIGAFPPIQTKKQFAAMMQMSTRTVVEWMHRGMPFLKPGPRKSLILTSDALAWLNANYSVRGRPSNFKPRKGIKPTSDQLKTKSTGPDRPKQ